MGWVAGKIDGRLGKRDWLARNERWVAGKEGCVAEKEEYMAGKECWVAGKGMNAQEKRRGTWERGMVAYCLGTKDEYIRKTVGWLCKSDEWVKKR